MMSMFPGNPRHKDVDFPYPVGPRKDNPRPKLDYEKFIGEPVEAHEKLINPDIKYKKQWIQEFQLEPKPRSGVMMPYPAYILAVGVKDGKICIWAEVYPNTTPKEKIFYVFQSNRKIPAGNDMKYLNTVVIDNTAFHVCMEREK